MAETTAPSPDRYKSAPSRRRLRPPPRDLAEGTARIFQNHTHDLDHIDWNLFTGRPALPFDPNPIRKLVGGKRILVTGAGGSIACNLVKSLAQLGPAELILVDQGELGLHQLNSDLCTGELTPKIRLLVGSVVDTSFVHEIFTHHQPQIVFHAAACKHVPLMELNPFTAASTNILGSERIVKAAALAGSEQCVLLSTDKAVEPRSFMGATKRFAELLSLAGTGPTQNKALRLGNVLGSSGSVVPLFLDQLRRGGPVTVTHPEATRYFLTVSEAVQHLLSSLSIDTARALLVAEMGQPRSIHALARFLIQQTAANPAAIAITVTGLREGDKLSERMISDTETLRTEPKNSLQEVHTRSLSPVDLERCTAELSAAVRTRDLGALLRSVQSVVPDYQPAESILRQSGTAIAEARSR